MTESLKKYLNSDPQVKQQFIQYLDEGNLFDAYNLCRRHVYDKDIFELFTEVECFENLNQSKNYWFVVYDLTFRKEEVVVSENSSWNKDPVVFNCMLDVLEELKPYSGYHRYRIEKISKNAAVKPFGKHYRFDCFVPDIQSKMSVFDEDNIVDAIRGALNREWSENTHDMYDGQIDKTKYTIKLLKIKIDKEKRTNSWIATVKYRIAAINDDYPKYVNRDTGECSDECTVVIPKNKKLSPEVLLQARAIEHFSPTSSWIKELTYNKKQDDAQKEEDQKLLVKKLIKKVTASLPDVDLEFSDLTNCFYLDKIDEVWIDYENYERKFSLIEGESIEDTYKRLDEYIQKIRDKLIPYALEMARKKKNKEERTKYIEKVIEQVKDEIKDTLPDIRSYFTHDKNVKFVSDKLLKSVTYELDGETGDVEFNKNTFKLENIIADILAVKKPEKDRVHGRSPLTLHLNEKKRQ